VSKPKNTGSLADLTPNKPRVLSQVRVLLLVFAALTVVSLKMAVQAHVNAMAPVREVDTPFPRYDTLAECSRPTAPHGHLTPSDITRNRVHNGLPGKTDLQVFDLRDVLEQLVLAAVDWQSPCIGGAHFGTMAPVLVVAIGADGLQPPGMLSAWSASSPPAARCATASCAEFAFVPMAAVRHENIVLPAGLATRLAGGTLFLAMANPVCVPVTGVTKASTEVVPGCPRAVPGGAFTVVSHRRAVTATCSGTLLHPSATRTSMSPAPIIINFAKEAAVCVQNYASLAALDANLCTNTSTSTIPVPGTSANGPEPGVGAGFEA
jgi:hypothetical protein